MSLPRPYYSEDGVTIYHADAREVLPLLAGEFVHMVLTDPPYGVRACCRSQALAWYNGRMKHLIDRIDGIAVAVGFGGAVLLILEFVALIRGL